MSACPLCQHDDLQLFHQDKKRQYWQCNQCQLVTVPAEFHLNSEQEKAFYDLHDNTVADEGYQRFLSRTFTPLLAYINPDNIGLDYGCGEGAVLSQMAAKQGIRVANYDLYYHYHPELLTQQYDFITMTEVIEHIVDAKGLLQQLQGLLKAKGVVAIMTKRVLSHDAFVHWHYKNDPTHINFYALDTFKWIAKHTGWRLEEVANDVVFLHKG